MVFRVYRWGFTIENRIHFGPPQAETFGVFRGYSGDFTIENRMHFGPPQAEIFGFGVPQISKILVLTFTLVLTLRLVWHSRAEVRSPNTKVNTASLTSNDVFALKR